MLTEFWYTAWVDTGQSDVVNLKTEKLTEQDKQADDNDKRAWLQRILVVRIEGST